MNDRLKKIMEELGLSDAPPDIREKIQNAKSVADIEQIADTLKEDCVRQLRERHPKLNDLEIAIIVDASKDLLLRLAHHKIAVTAYVKTIESAAEAASYELPDKFEICVCDVPRLVLEFMSSWYAQFPCKKEKKKV